MMDILSIRDLHVSYGKKSILKGMNLNIKEKKITAIVGPSGCGKSTLLKTINGIVREEEESVVKGNIFLKDENTRKIYESELRKRVGMVFQNPTPFPFSIYKNMIYGPVYYGIKDKKKLNEIVVDKLSISGLYSEVKDDLNMRATKLSGGQQQRLCIARALTVEPEILLLDEPCSALDIKNTDKIEQMLKHLSSYYTVVIVTHNLSQAKRISDYTAFMLDGDVIEYGESKAIFESPKDGRTKDYIQGIYG
jgi:phosphate transport system ATP-binding protein